MKKQHRNNRVVRRILFVCYGAVMLYLLVVRGRGPVGALSYWEQVANNYNLTPFHTISNYWDILTRPEYYLEKFGAGSIYRTQARIAVVNLLGNIVMFVPLGFFLPLVWVRLRKLWKSFLTAVGMILLVELAQLLSLRGSCDVDDLILNLVGMTLGFIFYHICVSKR